MAIDELPRTYRDAIAITQALGVRFLWMDSLCIIQDDEPDWQVEASKMASVFHGSYLTIAATASNDTEGGFFFDPDDTVLRIELPTIDSCNSTSDTNQSNTFIYERIPFPKRNPRLRCLFETPLNKRGWVLQELVLSHRTVRFAKDQLYWQCRLDLLCEDGLCREKGLRSIKHALSRGDPMQNLENPMSGRPAWRHWVQ